MLSAEGQRGAVAAATAAEHAGADYRLPEQWQWPPLDGTPAVDDRLACDPAGFESAC
jgi:hypothetical protein